MFKNKKGQSTLEYILLVTAVVVILLAFLTAPTSPFRTALNGTLDDVSGQMGDMGSRLGDSRPLAP